MKRNDWLWYVMAAALIAAAWWIAGTRGLRCYESPEPAITVYR